MEIGIKPDPDPNSLSPKKKAGKLEKGQTKTMLDFFGKKSEVTEA